jgi:hypothetical protein
MKTIKLACIASILATSIAYAGAPCDGFEITVKNNLPDKLIASTVKLSGADIKPLLVEINSKSENVFTVSGSIEGEDMHGELVFKTISLPSKTIHVEFDLKNQILLCQHTNKELDNEYPVTHIRLPSKVVYTIG